MAPLSNRRLGSSRCAAVAVITPEVTVMDTKPWPKRLAAAADRAAPVSATDSAYRRGSKLGALARIVASAALITPPLSVGETITGPKSAMSVTTSPEETRLTSVSAMRSAVFPFAACNVTGTLVGSRARNADTCAIV